MMGGVCTEQRRHIGLGSTGPRLRVTTALGSPQQRTWHLYRPVSLIGSRPDAHVRLDDEAVCESHAVLINTGRHIWIKDLVTPLGLLRNRELVRVARLSDGDVLRVGPVPMQIAIRQLGAAHRVAAMEEASSIPVVRVRLIGPGGNQVQMDAPISILGSRKGVDGVFHHDEIAPVHLLFVTLDEQRWITNLSSAGLSLLNGQPLVTGEASSLEHGDSLSLGPLEWSVELETLTPAEPSPSNVAAALNNRLLQGWLGSGGAGDMEDRISALQESIRALGQNLEKPRSESKAPGDPGEP